MGKPGSAVHRIGLVLGIVILATFDAPAVAVATIVVPPLTIYQLDHVTRADGKASSAITIPGSGYTYGALTAAIATGDVISVRIQAPPGKKFVVRAPATFFVVVYWYSTIAGGGSSIEEPHTAAFENLQGAVPGQTYSFVHLGDSRRVIEVQKSYQSAGPFEFTAFAVDITAAKPYETVEREYSKLGSWGAPSIGAVGQPLTPGAPIMEIVDMVTPARPSTFGRLKSLYR